LLHELGHGAAHAGNQERGLFLSWTATHDEVMAIVLEHAAAELLLSDNYLAAARAIWAVESCRCALSALFEFALWQTPDRAEELYPTYYRQIVRDPGPPELWVLDSFRSIDPVYIYTYVVGAATANRTVSFLRNRFGNDGRRWGRWLANRWLASGRRLTLPEKLAAIPGAAWHHD